MLRGIEIIQDLRIAGPLHVHLKHMPDDRRGIRIQLIGFIRRDGVARRNLAAEILTIRSQMLVCHDNAV